MPCRVVTCDTARWSGSTPWDVGRGTGSPARSWGAHCRRRSGTPSSRRWRTDRPAPDGDRNADRRTRSVTTMVRPRRPVVMPSSVLSQNPALALVGVLAGGGRQRDRDAALALVGVLTAGGRRRDRDAAFTLVGVLAGRVDLGRCGRSAGAVPAGDRVRDVLRNAPPRTATKARTLRMTSKRRRRGDGSRSGPEPPTVGAAPGALDGGACNASVGGGDGHGALLLIGRAVPVCPWTVSPACCRPPVAACSAVVSHGKQIAEPD